MSVNFDSLVWNNVVSREMSSGVLHMVTGSAGLVSYASVQIICIRNAIVGVEVQGPAKQTAKMHTNSAICGHK